jgi:hypothetical protein
MTSKVLPWPNSMAGTRTGVSCRPVRSQDVPAGSSTVIAMFAVVQRVLSRLFRPRQRLRRGHPSPSDEPGAVGRGSEVSLEPKSEALDTACAQPGCTGTIVDGYCDVR